MMRASRSFLQRRFQKQKTSNHKRPILYKRQNFKDQITDIMSGMNISPELKQTIQKVVVKLAPQIMPDDMNKDDMEKIVGARDEERISQEGQKPPVGLALPDETLQRENIFMFLDMIADAKKNNISDDKLKSYCCKILEGLTPEEGETKSKEAEKKSEEEDVVLIFLDMIADAKENNISKDKMKSYHCKILEGLKSEEEETKSEDADMVRDLLREDSFEGDAKEGEAKEGEAKEGEGSESSISDEEAKLSHSGKKHLDALRKKRFAQKRDFYKKYYKIGKKIAASSRAYDEALDTQDKQAMQSEWQKAAALRAQRNALDDAPSKYYHCIPHGMTASEIIDHHAYNQGQDPTHAVIYCHGLGDSARGNKDVVKTLDVLFENDKAKPDAKEKRSAFSTVLMSQKGINKQKSAKQLLEGLKKRGYKSFSVVAFSGGNQMAQKLVQAASKNTASPQDKMDCKGLVMLTPVAPKKTDFMHLRDKLAFRYLVQKQKKGFAEDIPVKVIYDPNDKYILHAGSEDAYKEQIMHMMGDKEDKITFITKLLPSNYKAPFYVHKPHLTSLKYFKSKAQTEVKDPNRLCDVLNPQVSE